MPPSTRTTDRPAADPRPRRRRWRRILLTFIVVFGLLVTAGWVWVRGHIGPYVVREVCSASAGGMSTLLSPEQAGNAATITAIAMKRGLPARAATIGIATAIQESKLRNLDHGDRDSLGLFQQRPSQGWGTPEQVRDPVYATHAFYDVLVKVEGFQSLEITDAAQKVQRSAFPRAYADHESEGRALASTLSGYSPRGLTCVLRPLGELADEQVGDAGLTARARRVLVAAGEEVGAVSRGPASPAGTSVAFTAVDARRGWALAHWAVARADSLHIVSVATDGRIWRRDEPGQAWAPDDAAPGAETVIITVG